MYVNKLVACYCLCLLSAPGLLAQTEPRKKVQAVRISEPMEIDGVLSESIWQRPGFTDFKQQFPNEGAAPSQRSEVWVAYDNEAIYVAARLYDTAPDSLISILARRDGSLTGDRFTFFVDPYYDHRSGFYFGVSAAGGLFDGTLYNDDWDDDSWDGVWEGKFNVDAQGWTVEMRIPFSQLHFHQQDLYLWGVNFKRDVGRRNEKDYAVYTPQKESGFVSRFPDLEGIEHVDPPADIEILPYITSRAEYMHHAADDPFHTGSRYVPGMGADFKVGLGADLTLNATVNPDFGQVEVDPAVVNLSDVETFFQEKRPFFIEGANLFSQFGRGGASGSWSFNWSNPTFFYSRRIGRTPQGSLPNSDYADVPLGAHILGAGKLTGKVGGQWNVGMIHALTAREFADVQSSGVRSHIEVEPLTYYGIGRVQRDFNNGKQGLGTMVTYTERAFSDDRLRNQLSSSGLFAGLDGWTALDDDKTYVVTGWGGVSHVRGNQTEMLALQTNSRHYFQRPDAKELHIDSSATSLTGYSGRLFLNKQKGSVILNAALGMVDPNFEIDDLGFLWRTDVINYHTAVGYQWTDPTPYYQNASVTVATFGSYDFGGTKTWHGYWARGLWQLPNFYQFFAAYAYNPYTMATRATRGGPAMLNPIGWEVDFEVTSDSRQSVVVDLWGYTYIGGGGEQYYAEGNVQIKPSPNVLITLGPSYSRNIVQAQWVGSYADPTATLTYGSRYVFSDFYQTTIAANIRLNWTFTPQLSLQLFAQPLISSGDYFNFKEFLQPKTFNFRKYGEDASSISEVRSPSGDVQYTVDSDGGGPAAAYSFSNPDFNFKSLRGNAVLRWEYRPGSTLYLVWTQSRSDSENIGDFQFDHSLSRLVSATPDNIFLVKFSYWWNM